MQMSAGTINDTYQLVAIINRTPNNLIDSLSMYIFYTTLLSNIYVYSII